MPYFCLIRQATVYYYWVFIMAYKKLQELIKFVRRQTPDPTGPNDMEEFVSWVSDNLTTSSSPVYDYYNYYYNQGYVSGQEYNLQLLEGKRQSLYLHRTDAFYGESSGIKMDWGMALKHFASVSFSVNQDANHDWFIWFSAHEHNLPDWVVYRQDLIGERFNSGVYMFRARITPEIAGLTIDFTVSNESHPGGFTKVTANLVSLVYFTDLRNPDGGDSGP